MNKVGAIVRLMRWHKPIGAWLLLWPTLWGLWLSSDGHPSWSLVAVFVLGVWLTRSAGCVINDIWDRHIDPHVDRTRTRPLAAGEVSTREASAVFAVLMIISAALVFLFLPTQTWIYAVVGALLTVIYPGMKRVIHAPQCVLGIAFSWGIPMAVVATGGRFDGSLWLLWSLAWLWPVAYDTQYALADRDDDLRIGVRSTAILLGQHAERVVMLLQGLVLLGWLWLAWREGWACWYLLPWAAGVVVVYRQWLLMRQSEREAYTQAFCWNKWEGFFLLLSMIFGAF